MFWCRQEIKEKDFIIFSLIFFSSTKHNSLPQVETVSTTSYVTTLFKEQKNLYLSNFQTGTLTEDGLDLYTVVPHEIGERFGRCVNTISSLSVKSPLVQALASCHSLTSIQGQLKGDPLDLKMFEFSNWVCVSLLFCLLFIKN